MSKFTKEQLERRKNTFERNRRLKWLWPRHHPIYKGSRISHYCPALWWEEFKCDCTCDQCSSTRQRVKVHGVIEENQ